MIAAALIFAASVGLIVAAQTFVALVAGRTLQGLSAGMIAVVVPLYLAECLPPAIRGRGTAIFQLVLTIGIAAGLAVGTHYVRGVDAVAAGPADQLLKAQDHAWRAMFLTAIYPAVAFLVGSFCVSESPRWLLRRGRSAEALAALQRSRTEAQAQIEHREITASLQASAPVAGAPADSLWQRKYLVPFALSCAVLALTQATGINSILQLMVVILQKAGLPTAPAAAAATRVALVNVVFTAVGVLLVDKLGRKALLKIGTSGIAAALLVAGAIFYQIGAGRIAPSAATGGIVTACLMAFIASFAIGPGVCVWLALSELMPTRIRSRGMGYGLLINQGVSTAIAALFLPVVNRYGYAPMFFFWAACTIANFLIAAFLLPETKGNTLEEIEASFAG